MQQMCRNGNGSKKKYGIGKGYRSERINRMKKKILRVIFDEINIQY